MLPPSFTLDQDIYFDLPSYIWLPYPFLLCSEILFCTLTSAMPYVISRHGGSSDGTNILQFPVSSPKGHQEDQSSKSTRNHVNGFEPSTGRSQHSNGVNWRWQGGSKLSRPESLTHFDQLHQSPDEVDWINQSLCQLTYLRTTLQTARNANHIRRVELDSIGVVLDNIRSQIHSNDEPNLVSTKVSPNTRLSSLIASRNHLLIAPAGLATARISDGRTTRISGLQFPCPPRSASAQGSITSTLKFTPPKLLDAGWRQSSLSPSSDRSSVAWKESPTDPKFNHPHQGLPRSPAPRPKKLDSINSETLFDFSPRQSQASEPSLFSRQSLKKETDNSMTSEIELLPAQLILSPVAMHSPPINHYHDEIEMEWDKMDDLLTHIRPSARWPRFSRLRSLSDKLRVVSRQKLPKKARSLPQMFSYL